MDWVVSQLSFSSTKTKRELIASFVGENMYFPAQKFIASYVSDRWIVYARMDPELCTAIVDFNVPGKSNPPPVKLVATVSTQSRFLPTGTIKKYAIEWTDPSGKLASPSMPLNAWVQMENVAAQKSCIQGSPLVFKDLKYDDSKLVTLSGNQLSITPFGSDARLSTFLCSFGLSIRFPPLDFVSVICVEHTNSYSRERLVHRAFI